MKLLLEFSQKSDIFSTLILADRSFLKFLASALMDTCFFQVMLEAADKLSAASPRTTVFDKKRKAELAAKLAQRWQRWELSNFDYLMQVPLLSPT